MIAPLPGEFRGGQAAEFRIQLAHQLAGDLCITASQLRHHFRN